MLTDLEIVNNLGKIKVVKKDDKWGIWNEFNNSFQISLEYDEIRPLKLNSYYLVRKSNKWGLIMGNLIIIPIEYDNINSSILKDIYIEIFNNGLKSIFNIYGDVIIPFEYEDIKMYDEFIKVKKDNKWGTINYLNKWIIEPQWDYLSDPSHNIMIIYLNDKQGFIHTDGRILCNPEWDTVSTFNNNISIVSKDNKFYKMDMLGKLYNLS